jgi:hypothetical protein
VDDRAEDEDEERIKESVESIDEDRERDIGGMANRANMTQRRGCGSWTEK